MWIFYGESILNTSKIQEYAEYCAHTDEKLFYLSETDCGNYLALYAEPPKFMFLAAMTRGKSLARENWDISVDS